MIWFIQDHKNFHKKCILQLGVNQHYLFKNTIVTLLFISKRVANSILVHNPTPIYSCLVNQPPLASGQNTCACVLSPVQLYHRSQMHVRKALNIYTACYAILSRKFHPTNKCMSISHVLHVRGYKERYLSLVGMVYRIRICTPT